jgi:hypothetical protein
MITLEINEYAPILLKIQQIGAENVKQKEKRILKY